MDGASTDATTILLLVTVGAVIVYFKNQWTRRSTSKIFSSPPGPKGYPLFGNGFEFIGKSTEGYYQVLSRWFDEYPDIFSFRIGPTKFYGVSKPEHIKIILNNPKCLEKGERYNFIKFVLGDGLFTAPVEIWKKNRKTINPTFNQRNLNSFIGVFNEKAKSFLEALRNEENDGELDILHLVSICTLGTVSETIMGIKSRTITARLAELVDRMSEILQLRTINIVYYYDFIFRWTKYKSIMEKTNTEFQAFARNVISEKMRLHEDKLGRERNGVGEVEVEDEEKYKSMLDLLIKVSNDGTQFTEEQLKDEVNTFLVAGSDTTAHTICFCFLTLGMHQDIQEKVYEEVLDVLGEDGDVNSTHLSRLSYLEKCIKESMRLFPIGSIVLRTPSEDIDLDGTVIPKSSTIFIFPYHMHRNPKYWKEPLKFDPDRFSADELVKRHPYSFLGFSGGPRNCIGSKYAMMVMKTVIATSVRKYKFKTSYKSIDEVKCKLNLLLRPVYGFKLLVEPR